MVSNHANTGQLVYLVDMHASITVDMIDSRDGTHPTECKLSTSKAITPP